VEQEVVSDAAATRSKFVELKKAGDCFSKVNQEYAVSPLVTAQTSGAVELMPGTRVSPTDQSTRGINIPTFKRANRDSGYLYLIAFVVGCNGYATSPTFPCLNGAVAGAEAVRDVFKELGFNVIYKKDATAQVIRAVFSQIRLRMRLQHKHTDKYAPTRSQFVFYYAGHGYLGNATIDLCLSQLHDLVCV
jgi:hypothetical protein